MRPSTGSRRSLHGPVGVVDIGGSHVTAAVVRRGVDPRILERSSSALEADAGASELLRTISGTMGSLRTSVPGWHVALPGPFDYDRGTGTFAGVQKFSALSGVDLRVELASRLGCEPSGIRFVNDALAYGIGEWLASEARPTRFVCLTLGTGIGSAFLDAGVPVESGPEVPPHGWAHLLTVDGAPLEDVVSTRAIRGRYAADGGDTVDVREIAERARGGERLAAATLDAAMTDLGTALSPWIERFRATEVVVGGSMARSWSVIGPALVDAVTLTASPLTIRPARLADDAPLLGASMA